ncbi:PAS domain S-box protein, partial [candidate division KSB1 bacterium]|nr:PAS domain S-box protein [candidate division KSB1 bacterium]
VSISLIRYDRTEFGFSFWLFLATLLFSISCVFFFFLKTPGDVWYQTSYLYYWFGILFLAALPFVDMTQLKQSELELRRSLERSLQESEETLKQFRDLVETTEFGLLQMDQEAKIVYANNKAAKVMDVAKKEMEGMSIFEFMDTHNREIFEMEESRWMMGKAGLLDIDFSIKKTKIPVLLSVTPVTNVTGRFIGASLAFFDITSRIKEEKQIRKRLYRLEDTVKSKKEEIQNQKKQYDDTRKFYENLITELPVIILYIDMNGNCTYVNEYGSRILGYRAKELTRKKLPDFITDMEKLRESYGSAVKAELRDYRAKLKSQDGRVIMCSWTVRYTLNEKGDHNGLVCAGQDVTELLKLQQENEKFSQQVLRTEKGHESSLLFDHLDKLLPLDRHLFDDNGPQKILTGVCQILKNLGWEYAFASFIDEKNGKSHIIAKTGPTANAANELMTSRRVVFEQTLNFVKAEFRTSHSFFVKNAEGGGKKAGFGDQWEELDCLIVPIKITTKILGFFFLFVPKNGLWPDKDQLKLLELLGYKAAIDLENHRLYITMSTKNRQLERTNRHKTETFSTMSHELRTPLNSIITMSSFVVKWSDNLSEEQLKQVRIILHNGEKLLRLINNLLDISKLEAGKMEIQYSYFALPQLVEDCTETIKPLCDEKKLAFDVKTDQSLPRYIFSDSDKIEQVLNNILSNAVKYTERGRVTFMVSNDVETSTIIFTIKDTGIGIEKEDLDNIFLPFRQLDEAARARSKGTGLGLYVSRQLWEMMGGTIQVESKKGRGSTFTLQLQVKQMMEGSSPEQSDRPETELQKRIRRSSSKATVLTVDDNLENHYAVKMILNELGYRPIFATDGESGVKKAISEKPDMILLDMKMPGMDGYTAVREMRKHAALKETPIIAMTAQTAAEDKGKATVAGCNAYLPKPFTLKDINAVLDKWLK